MDFPSYADMQLVARDELLSKNSKITAEACDLAGTDVFAILSAAAAVGDELSGRLARLQAELLLSSARGIALDKLAFDRYGVLRKAASPAVGEVEFSTTAATVGAFSIPANVKLTTSDGVQFLTTAEVVFPSASTGPVVAPVRAADAGLDTQANSGTITNILDHIVGAPADLVVTNELATAGAADAETDDSLRGRALAFFLTARRGTLEAIKQGALAHPGVETATPFEALDELGRPAGVVQLIITDRFTEALAQLSAVPPAYATQSQALAVETFDALIDSRAAGINVDVEVAKVVLQSVVLALNFRAGYDATTAALQARARIVGYVNSLPAGASFVLDDAIEVLQAIPGLLVTGDEIVSPSGDVIPQPLEVLRTTMGFVTNAAAAVAA